MKEVYKYLIKKLKNETVVIGVSGGPDSMALLSILVDLKEKCNIKIVVCHINHNTGRAGQKLDQDFVEKYCNEKKLIFENLIIDNYGDDNFHNEARTIRYNFFEKNMYKYSAKYLLTAHHGDDLIETILMRIVRGSTLRGYAGFSKEFKLDDFIVLRPFITLTKDEIEQFNKENNISYRVDDSNQKTVYTRNRYRKTVLPFFKQEDKFVHKKFYKYSETLLKYNNYIDKIVLKKMKNIYKDKVLYLKQFNKEEDIIKDKIISYIFENIYDDDLMLITDKHTELIYELVKSKKSNSSIYLPNNIVVTKEYDKLLFYKDIYEEKNYEIELNDYVELVNGKKISKVDKFIKDSNFICKLNSNEIKLPLVVRSRRQGDKINVKGMSSSKKVNDIFINEKIPVKERNLWPLVVDSEGNIVWLPGLKKSKFDKTNDEIYDIILKYY